LSPNTAIASGFGWWVFSTPLLASTSENRIWFAGSNS
jgi:hypothetical protein